MPKSNLNLLEQQRRADLAALLEPSYQPHSYSPSQPSPSNSSLKFLYTDALGNLHDPEYKVFPTEEWKQLEVRRSSFDHHRKDGYLDEDDCTDDEEEDDHSASNCWDDPEYAFGGRKSRANPHHHHHPHPHLHPNAHATLPRKSNYAPRHTILPLQSGITVPHNSPSSSPHTPPLSFPSGSSPRSASFEEPHSASSTGPFSLFHTPDPSPPSPRSSSPASRKRPVRLLRRKPQHEIYDEDAQWEDEEDEEPETPTIQKEKPSASHPVQLEEKLAFSDDSTYVYELCEVVPRSDSASTRPTCKEVFTSLGQKTRRRWQYIQLSVQLSLFRTNRKWRRRFSF